MLNDSVLEKFKIAKKTGNDDGVMGVIRTLFPDIEVEAFLEKRSKKAKRRGK